MAGGALVLLAGVGATTVAVVAVSRAEQRYAAELMDRHGDDVERVVTAQVGMFANTVTDVAAAIGAQAELSALDFAAIVSGLNRQRLPGASGIAYVVPASDTQTGAVQASWRQAGATDLTLTPATAGVEHLYVVLDRPFDGAASVAGRDLNGITALAQTLRIARDAAAFTVSPAYVLTKDRALPTAQQQTSFTLTTPVYGHTGTPDAGVFHGWLVMGVRGGDFLNQTLHLQARGAVQIQLSDTSTTPAKVIAAVTAGTVLPGERLRRDETLTVGQRGWQLTLSPTTRLLSTTDRRLALMTGVGGAVLTMLLTVLVESSPAPRTGPWRRSTPPPPHCAWTSGAGRRPRNASRNARTSSPAGLRRVLVADGVLPQRDQQPARLEQRIPLPPQRSPSRATDGWCAPSPPGTTRAACGAGDGAAVLQIQHVPWISLAR